VGCVHANNTTTCDDGLFCTVGDTCSGGACHGAPRVCNPAGACVTGSCDENTDQCVYQANGLCGVSGEVLYYRDNSGSGTEPSEKPVPNVGIDTTGDANAEAITDPSGLYSVQSLMGDVTVRPVPKFGTTRAADNNDSVSSFDALLVARHAVHLITLTGKQQLAGDVSGNGTVTAYDAALVSQFAAQILNHLPVAESKGSDWQFLRCDGYPVCTDPAYSYTPLSGPETANFYAILYGDVSGNWQSATNLISTSAKARTIPEETEAIVKDRVAATRLAGRPVLAGSQRKGAVSVYAENMTAPIGRSTQRTLYVSAENAVGIQGLDLSLDYDPALVSIVNVEAVDQASGYNAIWNDTPGSLEIAFYGYTPIENAGRLVKITVESKGRGPIVAPRLSRAHANEGSILTRIVTSPKGTRWRDEGTDAGGPPSAAAGGVPKTPNRSVRVPSSVATPTARPTGATVTKPEQGPAADPIGAGPIDATPPTTGPVYVENATAPVEGSRQRAVFVSVKDASGMRGLDLTLAYDPSRLTIVNVQAADRASGREPIWKATSGSLEIAVDGAAPIKAGRLLEITVQAAHDGPVAAPRLIRVEANDRAVSNDENPVPPEKTNP
jgi:hypothetical protein